MNATPALVDLFCGAGLFSQGFVAAGCRPVLAVDADQDSVHSYNRNVRASAKIGKVTSQADNIRCDVLLAGPPCQGFSTLGTRNPDDLRNSLCLEIPRWAKATKCKLVVIENVPQFLHSAQYQTMLRQLQSQGFDTLVWVLNAADYGVPQNRKRGFTLASRIGLPQCPEKEKTKIPVREAFCNIRPSNDPLCVAPVPSVLALERFKSIPYGGDKRDLMRNAPSLCPTSWFDLGQQATDVWGRMRWENPANTLRCCFQQPSKGRYLHPEENRTITLREGARLQTVPDSWSFYGSRGSIARQIGNGVPVRLSYKIARSVLSLYKQ